MAGCKLKKFKPQIKYHATINYQSHRRHIGRKCRLIVNDCQLQKKYPWYFNARDVNIAYQLIIAVSNSHYFVRGFC